jgi:hypothetical protein
VPTERRGTLPEDLAHEVFVELEHASA